ncbi:MAG: RsmE family RNA methyltransferase [Bacteroidota bacterium]|nr:RsmE family RNA methyltransferase [Bacteroidota bacterium]
MDIFYNKNILESNQEIIFSADETKHFIRVLRKNIGDEITVTNGKGLEWVGLISSVDLKHSRANKLSATVKSRPAENMHIAISPIKSNSRMDWFIEKATEIGVNEITPIICSNTERRNLNMDRCHKIMISAIKQSKRFFIPRLNPIVSFNDFIDLNSNENELYLAHCHKMKKNEVHELKFMSDKIIVMIGPEGDFSIKEVELCIKKGVIPISLGSNRLRTETAGILAANNFFIKKHILRS